MDTINSDEQLSNQFLCVTNDEAIDMDGFIEELDHCWEESVEDFNSDVPLAPSNILNKAESHSNKNKPPESTASIESNEYPLIQEIVTKNQGDDEENSVYHCSSCDVHLHNVMGHIKKYHKSRSVTIKSLDDNDDEEIKKEDSLEKKKQQNSQTNNNKNNMFVNHKVLSQNYVELDNETLDSKQTEKVFTTINENYAYHQNYETESFIYVESNDSINAVDCESISIPEEESMASESIEYDDTIDTIDTTELLDTLELEVQTEDDNTYTDLMEVVEVNEDYIAENLKEENEDFVTLDESENFEDLVIFNSKQTSDDYIEYVDVSDVDLNSARRINVAKSTLKPQFKCEICLQVLKSKYNHRIHMKNYHPPSATKGSQFEEKEEFLCSVCNTYFPSAKNLGLHRKMHKMPFKTITLEEATKYSSPTKEQLTEFFYCNLCDKKFANNLKDAHKKFHDTENNKFLCGKCNRNYANKIDYTYHMKIHEVENETERPTKRLTKAEKLGIKLPYECKYCGRTFSRPYEKVKHERIHTGEKPFKCEVCGKCFRVSYSLTLHLRTHTNNRPYACSVCNKRFKSHGVYAHHLLTHSDERNFKCDECPKAFKTLVQLHGHRNSHKKPFNCLQCNRKFASMFAVKFHMETHKKVQIGIKYSCNICGAMYAREYALKDHLKEAHDNVKYEDFTTQILDSDFNFIEEDSNSIINEDI